MHFLKNMYLCYFEFFSLWITSLDKFLGFEKDFFSDKTLVLLNAGVMCIALAFYSTTTCTYHKVGTKPKMTMSTVFFNPISSRDGKHKSPHLLLWPNYCKYLGNVKFKNCGALIFAAIKIVLLIWCRKLQS